MPTKTKYSVHRVRLINFHNFIDETIEISEGGHLFLLGDNGSGKTTLLDALHLVLAGMEGMEFNAAARVVGSARMGRRPVGIILRQNIEKPRPLNPNGGITYSAVELRSKDDRKICLVLGMRARSLDDNVSWWGAVKSCRLEELQLLKNTIEGQVPLNRSEFRTELNDERAFCANHVTYQKKLSSRLYGSGEDNNSLFIEMRRLLSMGKAYREIAAGTSDYHDLFKKLLPEPKKELFNDVVQTLRELEQSNTELAGLEEKQHYLESLAELVKKIDQHRETALRYQWLVHYLNIHNLDEQSHTNKENQQQAETELEACHESIFQAKREKDRLQQALNNLQKQDSGGTLLKREELSQRQSRIKEEVQRQKQVEHERELNLKKLDQKVLSTDQEWRAALKRFYDEFNRLNPKLPFPIVGLLEQIDEQLRLNDLYNATIPISSEIEDQAESENRKVLLIQNEISQKINELKIRQNTIEDSIEELQSRQDLIPSVPHFVDAQRALEREMIQATPLYMGLEWRAGMSASDQAALEEAIGTDVLSTLIVLSEDLEVAQRTVYQRFPCIRIAISETPERNLPDWIRKSFDIKISDPDAINVLIEEMSAKHHPEIEVNPDWMVLHFRAHGRRLSAATQGLIGSEQRKSALQRRIRELEQELKQVNSAIREQEKLQRENAQVIEYLDKLNGFLREFPHTLGNSIRVAQARKQQDDNERQRLAEFQVTLYRSIQELQSIDEQLSDIQAKIEQQGLDKLEKKQRSYERQLKIKETEIEELNQQVGGLKDRKIGLQQKLEIIKNRHTEELKSLERLTEELKPYVEAVENVEYYVLKTNRGQQFTRVENVQQETLRNDRESYETIAELTSKLNDPGFGAVYAFNYDRASNLLHDRHQAPITEVVQAVRREIDEQRQVINEKTQKLIHDLIMGELFIELKASVSILQTMVRKINGLLRDRNFGSTRYRFNLPEVPHYRDLLAAIQRFHPHSSEAKQELEGFLELHKGEIMNTESGDIPEALDYRNWFHYELVVQSIDTQGDVVMDRKTKSLGSGGEQAVPNYLLILTVAHLLYEGNDELRLRVLIFDEAFYGIDAGRRDQLLGFASDLGLQLFIASPDLDGVKKEVAYSTTILVVKDKNCDVHLFYYNFKNPPQTSLLDDSQESATLKPLIRNEDE